VDNQIAARVPGPSSAIARFTSASSAGSAAESPRGAGFATQATNANRTPMLAPRFMP
jgi:hypothetical protein